jgi:DNA-binding MarR family transcriptional regulator
MPDDSIQALTSAMISGGSALLREATRLFRPFGVTAAQFNALHLLADTPEGLRPSDLTRSLVVDPSSITYLIDELEKREWLCRTSDLPDRRAYRVRLTPQGMTIHVKINALYQASLAEIAQEIDVKDARRIAELLLQIQRAAVAAVDRVAGQNQMGDNAATRRPRPAGTKATFSRKTNSPTPIL